MLTLRADHTKEELELARLVAEVLNSRELHVFWPLASSLDSRACRVQDPKE